MYDPCVLTCPYFGPYIGILIAHKNSKREEKKREYTLHGLIFMCNIAL